jgi:aspartyl-tRNA(Asn)/glutamyl-tRNA(Gln) amidotransferase subunit C
MTKLSKADVKRLSDLARLKLSEEELDRFSGEFSAILDYVEQLKDADTEGLKPTYQVNRLSTVTRPDEFIEVRKLSIPCAYCCR